MRPRFSSLSLLTLLCCALCAPAFTQNLMYSNGPTQGTTNAWFIDVFAVSNSFVPGFDGYVSSFTFAEWVTPGARPLTVDWSLGTSSFASDLGQQADAGIASATLLCTSGSRFNGGICGGGLGFDVYNSTVNVLEDVGVSKGATYWLTLTNATDSFGGRDGWDINSGPSMAYHNVLGNVPSESFTVEGCYTLSTCPIPTPEPGSIILFATGIAGVGGIVRRRRRQ